jgi:methionine-rich copper-binding protein CopC
MKSCFWTISKSQGLLGMGVALLVSLWLAGGAVAHALLLKSEPEAGAALAQSPQQVIIWFSQELDTGFSALQVMDEQGYQVDSGDGGVDLNDPDHASLVVSLPADLPAGRYTAHWTAVSAEDGDTTEGEFFFTVGETGPVQAIAPNESAAARWAVWLVGGIVFGLGVLLVAVMVFAWGFSRSRRDHLDSKIR